MIAEIMPINHAYKIYQKVLAVSSFISGGNTNYKKIKSNAMVKTKEKKKNFKVNMNTNKTKQKS